MKSKIISLQTFNEILEAGAGVPRTANGYTCENLFSVGKEYIVRNNEDKRTFKAICTQNCPAALKVIF